MIRARLTFSAFMAHSTRTCFQPSSLAVGFFDSLRVSTGKHILSVAGAVDVT